MGSGFRWACQAVAMTCHLRPDELVVASRSRLQKDAGLPLGSEELA